MSDRYKVHLTHPDHSDQLLCRKYHNMLDETTDIEAVTCQSCLAIIKSPEFDKFGAW